MICEVCRVEETRSILAGYTDSKNKCEDKDEEEVGAHGGAAGKEERGW